MRFVSAIAVLCVVFIPSAQAAKQRTLPIERHVVQVVEKKQERSARQQQALKSTRETVRKFRSLAWQCQDALPGSSRTRAAVSIWALPKSVAYRDWAATKWKDRAAACQAQLERRSIPATSDWLTSVRLVQRIYPGTDGWLTRISSREGGHGGFKMNNQGSGCGGWLQFMSSTYYAYSDDAFADAARRGFIVNPSWNSWSHPMGQALTGAYMRYTGRDGHHWAATDY